jgi:acyl transferase domain-containing protein
MLSVPMAEADLRPRLTGDLDMASVNAPGLCVVSGPDAALKTLAGTLAAEGVETQRIAIDIAAHSPHAGTDPLGALATICIRSR